MSSSTLQKKSYSVALSGSKTKKETEKDKVDKFTPIGIVPIEIFEQICSFLKPVDVKNLFSTCKFLNENSYYLIKRAFLNENEITNKRFLQQALISKNLDATIFLQLHDLYLY